MMQEDQSTQLQSEVNALKRQVRQLLEVVALVQQERGPQRPPVHAQHREPATGEAAVEGPAEVATAALPGRGQDRPAEHSQAESEWAAALIEENRRLAELVRAQAEELGALRDRLAREQKTEPLGQALGVLLRALRESE